MEERADAERARLMCMLCLCCLCVGSLGGVRVNNFETGYRQAGMRHARCTYMPGWCGREYERNTGAQLVFLLLNLRMLRYVSGFLQGLV